MCFRFTMANDQVLVPPCTDAVSVEIYLTLRLDGSIAKVLALMNLLTYLLSEI